MIRMKADDRTFEVDGQQLVNDVPPLNISDRTYVPIRFVAEHMGLNVYLAAQYAAGMPVEVAYVRKTPYEESIETAGLQCMRGETVYSSSATVAPSKLYVKYETNL